MNTFEKVVILIGVTGSGFLVRMMSEYLFAVGKLDLLGGRAIAVLAQAQNSIVILSLMGY